MLFEKSYHGRPAVERVLRGQFNYLKRLRKIDHSPEVRALRDKIFQQRSRLAARRPLRKRLSSTTTTCKKVFQWMDANEVTLPALFKKLTPDIQRAEVLLRRQCKYLMSKINHLPEARAVLEQIESGLDSRSKSTRSADSDTTTCNNVLDWMDSHENALPKEYRKPTSDA